MKDYYKILGVVPSASDDQIRQVYRQKAKLLHPDLNNNNPQAADKLVEINEAYGVLSDKESRAQYNREIQAAQRQQNGGGFGQGGPGMGRGGPGGSGMGRGGPGGPGQQQQQINIEQITAAAYNQGYAKGFNDCAGKVAAEKDAAYGQQIKVLTDRVKSAENDKLKLIKRVKALEDEVGELTAQNESLWIQIGDDRDAATDSRPQKLVSDERMREEVVKLVETLNARIKAATEENAALKERQRAAEDAVFEKEMTITQLTEENKMLSERVASYEVYVNSREGEDHYEEIIREREDKLKQVKKMIKNTYYGSLGVVYWAENEEIFAAYDKLKRRYGAKVAKGDYKAAQKLKELENAYNTLINETARNSYNATIDITDEDIELERQEQKDYDIAMEKHLAAKAEDEFWAYIDELMFLSQTGDAESQFILGEMYYFGDEIEQDLDQAFYWFKEAAKQQNADALLSLGKCYLNGEGTPRDEQKGIGFIKQAAKLGNAEALSFVGSVSKK